MPSKGESGYARMCVRCNVKLTVDTKVYRKVNCVYRSAVHVIYL